MIEFVKIFFCFLFLWLVIIQSSMVKFVIHNQIRVIKNINCLQVLKHLLWVNELYQALTLVILICVLSWPLEDHVTENKPWDISLTSYPNSHILSPLEKKKKWWVKNRCLYFPDYSQAKAGLDSVVENPQRCLSKIQVWGHLMFTRDKRLSRNSFHNAAHALLQKSPPRRKLRSAVQSLLNDSHVRLGQSSGHSWLRILSSTVTISEHMGSLISLHSCPSV